MKDFTPLYLGTLAMTIFAVVIVIFVLWVAGIIKRINKKNEDRDAVYLQRFNKIEITIIEKIDNLITLLSK